MHFIDWKESLQGNTHRSQSLQVVYWVEYVGSFGVELYGGVRIIYLEVPIYFSLWNYSFPALESHSSRDRYYIIVEANTDMEKPNSKLQEKINQSR